MGMPVIQPSNIDRCDAITDIIQSVALQQTALSHILNAEGEKIQKVVAMDDVTTEELLHVNKSAQSMVESISRLEMMLQSKLSLFEDCLCDCKDCCLPLQDTKLTTDSIKTISIKKTNKNNYIVEVLSGGLPAILTLETTPNVPVTAVTLPKDMKFENNTLYVGKTLGAVVLLAGKGKCAEYINIDFRELS